MKSTISDKTGDALLKIARNTINNFPVQNSRSEMLISEQEFTLPEPVSVYICLWHQGKIRGFGSSHYKPLKSGVHEATLCALQTPVDGTLLLFGEIQDVKIEISIRKSFKQLADPDQIKEQQKISNSGLSLFNKGKWFDLLPDKIIRSGMTVPDQCSYLLALARLNEESVTVDQWYLSKWEQFVEQAPDKCQVLYKGRIRDTFLVSKKSCLEAAVLSAKRLVRQQNICGQFTYEYLPFTDQISNQKYNLVRMAGTTFSMSMLAHLVKDKTLKKSFQECSENAFRYLFELAKPARHVEKGLYIAEATSGFDSYQGKLGTSALTLLALQFGSFYRKYKDERQGLIETILGLQRPTGDFACHIPPKQKIDDCSVENCQNYFPGEALLALVYELKHSFNPRIAQCVIRSFNFYRDFFTRQPNTAFVLWQVSAWALFHELIGKEDQLAAMCATAGLTQEEVVKFVYEQSDFILELQYNENNTKRKDFWGGFPNTGTPGSVSSCYLEAVIRAADLAARCGDRQQHEVYKYAAIEGIRFMDRLQVKESEAYMFQKPGYTVGGIISSLGAFKLRNDRDQHAITAFIAAIETPSLFTTLDIKTNYQYETPDLHLLQKS